MANDKILDDSPSAKTQETAVFAIDLKGDQAVVPASLEPFPEDYTLLSLERKARILQGDVRIWIVLLLADSQKCDLPAAGEKPLRQVDGVTG